MVKRCEIVIGLTQKDFPLNKLPGMTAKGEFSIGYSSRGEIMISKEIKTYFLPFQEGDTIGCGINFYDQTVFFTNNGIKSPFSFKLEFGDSVPREFYPTGGLKGVDCCVEFNFGKKSFDLNLEAEIALLQKLIQK